MATRKYPWSRLCTITVYCCPAATFFRNGQVCEECLDRSLWRGIRHGCYRGSRAATAVVAAMLWFHRFRKTWIAEIAARINRSRPDVVWVGLSTPKQERWMFEHRHRLTAPVLVGVGAAFDFHGGLRKQAAPRWMQEHGFEWLFRLLQEPRRLWRRYLVYGSEFVYLVALEQLGIRKWD
ncbi:MAG TPA: WecB/TagA/CpsF family glycosyltransferase [Candidatus Aquilonibacter sp.]|nr:WecB/TagA/CpsF family glycosyltransferase [Candidatus Aquilonibacter sp.]